MSAMKRLLVMLMMLCLLAPLAAAEADGNEAEVYIPAEDEELVAAAALLDEERDDTVDPDELFLNRNLPDHVINILLIGIDDRSKDIDNKEDYQHGDVQIIVSLNKETGSIKLTSVMRDLYVKIPGYETMQRINIAYLRGGGKLAMKTINKLLEMNIQHYVSINFYGLAAIIDSLGGIDVELTGEEAAAINAYISKNLKNGGYDNRGEDYQRIPLEEAEGAQHLDGIQAVMYARLRSIDDDFKRTERQRYLLDLMLKKVLDDGIKLSEVYKLVMACLPYAKTDMSIWDMGGLAWDVLTSGVLDKLGKGGPLLEEFRIPMGDHESDRTWAFSIEHGDDVVIFRDDEYRRQNVESLHKFIYGEYIPAD